MKISPVGDKDEIEIPTVANFRAKVAEEFLGKHGARRFLSFVQRCQLSGPWAEAIKLSEKVGPVTKYVSYSKYEHELSVLLKRKKKLELLNSVLSEAESERLLYLETLVSDELANKSDTEMMEISREFIRKLNE